MAREYSEEVKAQVIAALLSGQSVNAAAREYNIPKGTVSGWKKRDVDGIIEGVAGVATQKSTQEEIGALILELVRVGLRSLIAQAEHTSDKEWLMKQTAQEVGQLYGISHDKMFRLLEALDRAEPESGDSES